MKNSVFCPILYISTGTWKNQGLWLIYWLWRLPLQRPLSSRHILFCICSGTWRNFELLLYRELVGIYKLWDLEKFRTLPFYKSLKTLKIPRNFSIENPWVKNRVKTWNMIFIFWLTQEISFSLSPSSSVVFIFPLVVLIFMSSYGTYVSWKVV